MDEPWTLVVVAVCACLMVCVLLFTIIRCCLCSYKGMKTYQNDLERYVIPFDYRPNVVIPVSGEPSISNINISSTVPIHQSSTSSTDEKHT